MKLLREIIENIENLNLNSLGLKYDSLKNRYIGQYKIELAKQFPALYWHENNNDCIIKEIVSIFNKSNSLYEIKYRAELYMSANYDRDIFEIKSSIDDLRGIDILLKEYREKGKKQFLKYINDENSAWKASYYADIYN